MSTELERAVKSIQRAVRKLPEGYSLFGNSGTLMVVHDGLTDESEQHCDQRIAVWTHLISDVYCDGGDPPNMHVTDVDWVTDYVTE